MSWLPRFGRYRTSTDDPTHPEGASGQYDGTELLVSWLGLTFSIALARRVR